MLQLPVSGGQLNGALAQRLVHLVQMAIGLQRGAMSFLDWCECSAKESTRPLDHAISGSGYETRRHQCSQCLLVNLDQVQGL
jgi:hypothetical protein